MNSPVSEPPSEKPHKFRWLTWLLWLVLLQTSAIAGPVALTDQTSALVTTDSVMFMPEHNGVNDISDARSAFSNGQFEHLPGSLSLGYFTEPIWLRFKVQAQHGPANQWWLEVNPPYLDHITLYQVTPSGVIETRQGGDTLKPSQQKESTRTSLFKLNLEPGEHVFYLRIQTSGAMTASLTFWSPSGFREHNRDTYMGLGIYFTLLASFFVVSLVATGLTGQRLFALYSAYLFFNILQWLGINGLLFDYVMPQYPFVSNLGLGLATPLAIGSGFLFFTYLFELARYHRFIYRLNLCVVFLAGLTALATLFGLYRQAYPVLLFFVLLSILASIFIFVRLWKTGLLRNRWLVVMHALFLVFVGYNITSSLGFFAYTDMGLYAGMVSNGFHVGTLSVVLVANFIDMKQQLHKSHDDLRDQVKRMSAFYEAKEQQEAFLIAMAHEVREPIAVIKSATDSLKLADAKKMDAAFRLIRYERLDQSVERVQLALEMGLLGMRNDVSQLNWAQIDLVPLTTDLVRIARGDRHGKVKITAPKEQMLVRSDNKLLSFCILNLIENAMKYAPANQAIAVSIGSNAETNSPWVFWSIEHSARLSDDEFNRLFERGFRGAGAQTGEGLGLGLYLVKRLMVHLGGHVEAKRPTNSKLRVVLGLPF